VPEGMIVTLRRILSIITGHAQLGDEQIQSGACRVFSLCNFLTSTWMPSPTRRLAS
jgi:hypothetical protein